MAFKSTLIAVSISLAASAGAAAQSLTPLTQAELETEFKRTVRYEYSTTGASGKIEHVADGKAKVIGKTSSGREIYDSGTYVVRDGSLCHTWTIIREGKEACFKFARRDGLLVSLDANGKEDGSRKEIK